MISGEELRERRGRLRLQQQQLAALCGVEASHLCRVEAGRKAVPVYVNTILRLLEHAPIDAVNELLEEYADEAH